MSKTERLAVDLPAHLLAGLRKFGPFRRLRLRE